MGDTCTRSCAFCGVQHGQAKELDQKEPEKVALAVQKLNLRYVVVTSVTRDDLADGGASHFARTVAAIRDIPPRRVIEILVPDFAGSQQSRDTIIASRPDIVSHNVETVPRLYPQVRKGADFQRSLALLRYLAESGSGVAVKSGFMAGLGESWEEIEALVAELAEAGVEQLVVGQYLRPDSRSIGVAEYFGEEYFQRIEELSRSKGIAQVYARPFARTSYALALANK
jgi:lipoic acid synthetase